MNAYAAVAALVAVSFLSALCSGMETGLYALDRIRLRIRAEEGDRRARRLLAAASAPAVSVSALLLANNVLNYFATDVASAALDHALPSMDVLSRQIADTLLLSPFLFVCCDLAPKDAFMRAPWRLMRLFEPFLTFVRGSCGTLVRPLLALFARFGRRDETKATDFLERAGLGRLLTEEQEIETLSPAQRRLAERVLRLRHVKVEERMTPIAGVVWVPADASAEAVAAAGLRCGKSRIPVRATPRGAFAGYVNVVDAVVAADAGEGDRPGFAGARLHELPFVARRSTVASALVRFQRRRRPLMQVLAAEGEPVGILAASDLVDALFDP